MDENDPFLTCLDAIRRSFETMTEQFARLRLRLTFEELLALKGLARHDIAEYAGISAAQTIEQVLNQSYLRRISWSFDVSTKVQVDYAGVKYTYCGQTTGYHDVNLITKGKVRVIVTPSASANGNVDIFSYDIANGNMCLEEMLK